MNIFLWSGQVASNVSQQNSIFLHRCHMSTLTLFIKKSIVIQSHFPVSCMNHRECHSIFFPCASIMNTFPSSSGKHFKKRLLLRSQNQQKTTQHNPFPFIRHKKYKIQLKIPKLCKKNRRGQTKFSVTLFIFPRKLLYCIFLTWSALLYLFSLQITPNVNKSFFGRSVAVAGSEKGIWNVFYDKFLSRDHRL